MKRRLLWSAGALEELSGAIAFIAENNVLAARKVRRSIGKTAMHLADMPTGRRGRVGGTYEKVVPGLPYIIAYALRPRLEGGEDVVVLRVVHGARDWREGGWPREES